MKSGLVSLLANESTISALVGSRIYVDNAPQKAALPHIVITQMNTDELKSLDGSSETRRITFDIDCKADRSLDAYTLGNTVRTFIDDYTGTAGSQTIDGVLMNDESGSIEPPHDNSDKPRYVVTLDVDIFYKPA